MNTILRPAAILAFLAASPAFAAFPMVSYDKPTVATRPNPRPKADAPENDWPTTTQSSLPTPKKLSEGSTQKITQKKVTLTSRDSEETTKPTTSLQQQLDWLEDKLQSHVAANIFGTWTVIGTHSDGDLYTAELKLDDSGTAKLTIPNQEGQPVTTRHRIAFDNQSLKLVGGQTDVQIGKILEVNERQMVVDGKSGVMTFVRR